MENKLEEIIERTIGNRKFDINALRRKPEYFSYLRVPKKVCEYLQYFKVNHEAKEIMGRLDIFFLWLKNVDECLDSKNVNGKVFLDRFQENEINMENDDIYEGIILTDILREITLNQNQDVLKGLGELYGAVLLEKDAENMHNLIEAKEKIGEHCASSTITIISPYMEKNERFNRFFIELGVIGNLADTIVDIKKDYKNGGIKFKLRFSEYIELYDRFLIKGAGMIIKHPLLIKSFLDSAEKAVFKNY